MRFRAAFVLLAVFVAAGLAFARPAGAVSKPAAQKAALAALGAAKVKGPVIVFGLPKPLPKGSAVSEAGPGPSHRGKATVSGDVETFTDTEPALPAGTWLFWMDLAPYAHFSHPSVMVLVGASGKVVRKQSLAWWPLVNGKAPAFFAPANYNSSRYRVFSHGVAAPKAVTAQIPAAVVEAWNGLAVAKFPNDCIIVMSDEVDPNFAGDLKAIDATATALQLPIAHATSAADLEKQVEKLSSATPACTDIVIYLDAHGSAASGSNYTTSSGGTIGESAHAQVSLKHIQYMPSPTGIGFTTTTKTVRVDATAVRKVMSAHMNLTFKLVVDSCFSGRWTELADQSNLRVILAASRSDQMSYSFIPNGTWAAQTQTGAVLTPTGASATINVTNTFMAGGFTNAVTTGLQGWAMKPGSVDLASGLVSAFNGSSTIDASQIIGFTVPGLTNFVSQRPHAPTGQGFNATVAMSYHHISQGQSEVCVRVTTVPPRPGAAVHLRVSGPGVVSGGDQNLTLGADGSLFVRIPINQYGDYTAGADITAAPGDTASSAGQETVTPTQGDCPAG